MWISSSSSHGRQAIIAQQQAPAPIHPQEMRPPKILSSESLQAHEAKKHQADGTFRRGQTGLGGEMVSFSEAVSLAMVVWAEASSETVFSVRTVAAWSEASFWARALAGLSCGATDDAAAFSAEELAGPDQILVPHH